MILPNTERRCKGNRAVGVLLDAVIPPGNEPGLGKLLDLDMLAMPGGRERTEAEFTRCSRATASR